MKTLTFFLFLVNNTLYAEVDESVDYLACGNNPKAIELAKLLIESKSQLRKKLHCNKTLVETALIKAKMMADADRIDHNLNNITPNELIRRSGIKLPSAYDFLGNQVESVSGGTSFPIEAFDQFMNSPPHRKHLMGESELGLEQDQIGVGFYQDKQKKHEQYWVVYITALRSQNDKNKRIPIIKHKYTMDKTSLKKKRN